jgi:exodeoxyribonuclease-3
MKVVSWNVNGLRAVYKRNFLKWLKSVNADFICLQEIKTQEDKLPQELLNVNKYHAYLRRKRADG